MLTALSDDNRPYRKLRFCTVAEELSHGLLKFCGGSVFTLLFPA
jgi:hypothetical protein